MRILLSAFLILAFISAVYSEDTQDKPKKTVLVYPKELLTPLPTVNPPDELPESNKEEFVEVESKAYPGLYIDLPDLNEQITIQKFQIRALPPTPDYYEMGGNPVLSWYGIHSPSGQLFTTSIDTTPGKKEEE